MFLKYARAMEAGRPFQPMFNADGGNGGGNADPSSGQDPNAGNDPNAGADPNAATPPGNQEPNGGQDPSQSGGTDPNGKTITLTQEEFDKKIQERLRRDRETKKYDELEDKAKKWEEHERNQLSEQDRINKDLADAQKRAQDAEAKASKMETEITKSRVLMDLGLPLTLMDRVQGATEDEIRADATALQQLMGVQAKPPVGGGSNPAGQGSGGTKIYTKAELGSMSQEAINANWDVISDQLNRGIIK
jgi:Domain of unknown function (DUF4355)